MEDDSSQCYTSYDESSSSGELQLPRASDPEGEFVLPYSPTNSYDQLYTYMLAMVLQDTKSQLGT